MLKIASLFGVGFLPKAPGTWGSLFGAFFFYVFNGILGAPLMIVLTIIVFFLGWRATYVVQRDNNVEDPGWIVIDEVAGMWIALLPVSIGMWNAHLDNWTFLWPGYLVAFVAFRFFDIKKPLIVGWADRRGDALGVMLDDVFAGVFAAVLVVVGAAVYHGLM